MESIFENYPYKITLIGSMIELNGGLIRPSYILSTHNELYQIGMNIKLPNPMFFVNKITSVEELQANALEISSYKKIKPLELALIFNDNNYYFQSNILSILKENVNKDVLNYIEIDLEKIKYEDNKNAE